MILLVFRTHELGRRVSHVYLNIKMGEFNRTIGYCKLPDTNKLYTIHTSPEVEISVSGNWFWGYAYFQQSDWYLEDSISGEVVLLPSWIRLPLGQVNAFKRAFNDQSCQITPILIRTHEYNVQPRLRKEPAGPNQTPHGRPINLAA